MAKYLPAKNIDSSLSAKEIAEKETVMTAPLPSLSGREWIAYTVRRVDPAEAGTMSGKWTPIVICKGCPR